MYTLKRWLFSLRLSRRLTDNKSVISYGKTKKGWLKRKCNACGRTFTLIAGTVMFSRKLKGEKLRAVSGNQACAVDGKGNCYAEAAEIGWEIGGQQIHDPRGRREAAAGQLVHSQNRAIRLCPPQARMECLDLYGAWVSFKASIKGKKIDEKIGGLLQICEELPAEFYRKNRRYRD